MSEEIRVVVEHRGVIRNLLWISLQGDDSISVGFLDQVFVFPGFTSERDLEDGMRDTQTVDLRATHTLQAITNPHFTLHPPYFQLRSGKNPPLLSGIVWTTPGPGELISPWIRFISNRVRELEIARPIVPKRTTRIQPLRVGSDDSSVAVYFDFVDERARQFPLVRERKAKIIVWRAVSLMTYAQPVPGQSPTVGFLIRG